MAVYSEEDWSLMRIDHSGHFTIFRMQKPPVGELRFQEPQPVEKWTGLLNTTDKKKISHQFNPPFSEDPRQTEDCLVLNVYTPVKPSKCEGETLPVLVWIHGGIFYNGNAGREVFGPDYFINEDIIVVTMNYRFGPFGFLSTEDSVIPANAGLKDQQLALKWVQNNIGVFGGDPSKVTIMGQGYGGFSVGYQILDKKSEGLFRGGIIQSGSPLTCFALQKYPKYVTYELGSRISKEIDHTKSSKQLLEVLQSASPEDIKKNALFELPADKLNCMKHSSGAWSPAKEDESFENALVTGMNHENIKNGNSNKIPLLIGINSEEVLTFGIVGLDSLGEMYDDNITTMITGNLNIKDENKKPAATKLKDLYTNGNLKDDIPAVISYGSDTIFTTPIARHAYLQSKYTDVYFYQFSYKGKLGQMEITYKGAEGVGHAEELKYLFRDSSNADLNKFPEEDVKTHQRMIDLWTQFIKYMNPTKNPSELTNNLSWPKVTQENFAYLDINSDLTVAVGPKKYKDFSEIYAEYADEKLDTY
uniref:Esterase n=1 Tax=Leptinotarsa decemlineata TaxID=7539 RepID=A0A0A7EP39_LEPDE|nr:esterase [Leptinotarsa decemlineata]